MSYCYLLDTNILSDLVKHPTGKIFSKIQSVGEEKICTSVIVACELRFGAEKSNSSRLQEIALILDGINVLPLATSLDIYSQIQMALSIQIHLFVELKP
jgi:tRNA(fMet)-specific endonuclease VapC